MRVLVTGAGGMVGRAVAEHCARLGDEVLPYDHTKLDIADAAYVRAVFESKQPDVVINCAAWTDVDGCELDPERAHLVNALGPENLAVACQRSGAQLVTISTDYVFDGRKEGFYTQRDQPLPESIYGKAKLEGERRAQAACARCAVVRTGWIFGPGGRNFLSRIIELAHRGQALKAIGDVYGTPTFASDLSARLRRLAEMDLPGVYHVTNNGEGTSYAEFAEAALHAAGYAEVAIETISQRSLSRPAPRPLNSRLRCVVSEAIGLEPLPFWRDALERFARNVAQGEAERQRP